MPIHDQESRSCLKLFIWQLSSFITDSMGMSSSKLLELVMGREARRAAVHGVTKSWTWLSEQTELKWTEQIFKNLKIQSLLTPCTFFYFLKCIFTSWDHLWQVPKISICWTAQKRMLEKNKPGRDLRHLLLTSRNILFYQGLGASLVAHMVKHLPACRRPELNRWVRKIPWRREWLRTLVFWFGESHGWRSLAGYRPHGCRVRHDWAINARYN